MASLKNCIELGWKKNKTNCAVSIFESESKIKYPEYINRVIEDVE